MALEREIDTFRKELPKLLQEGGQGRYALVHGDAVHSTWASMDEAVERGYELFGLETFWSKKLRPMKYQSIALAI